ncbi:unnamed protein product [Larinioides sclopetarius]|uniref:SEC14-like protein 2 n=1 Tax=Larinioides sclopetarius TaxID=280406 RepID=A0AAV2ALQ7_9ARAC
MEGTEIKIAFSYDIQLSPSEREAVEEMSRRISKDLPRKIHDEAFMYYRFLKAREFDVDGAEKMLRQTLQWRKDGNVDQILTDYKVPEVLQNHLKNFLFGYDKEGCPVYYMPIGKKDVRGLHMSARFYDLEKSFVHLSEETAKILGQQRKKLNKYLKGVVHIYDMEGLTFGNATCKKGIETSIKILKIHQDNYPEGLKALYIINASSLFTLPFNILKSFLNSRMLSKIHVYGSEGWKEVLLELMDADQLPVFLGGTRTDPDGNPLGKTFMNQGGKISEKYYIQKSINSLEKSPGVKRITLPRASFNEVIVEIKEAGSIIEWEFETKTRDIGFGLFYKDMVGEEEKMIELVELQRLETEDFSEVGMYKCDKNGEYIILFDNSYSWIRSKEVFYRINVVKPSDHEKNLKN